MNVEFHYDTTDEVRTVDEDNPALMTILGAARESDDSILIAGDSKVGKSDVASGEARDFSLEDKILNFKDKVLWGWYGVSDVGVPLSRQLEGYAFASWDELEGQSRELLKQLNWRTMSTGILMAGFVEDEPRIVWIDRLDSLRRDPEVMFCGWGRVAAKVAWEATLAVNPKTSSLDRLEASMSATVKEVDGLSLPVTIWRVSRTNPPVRLRPVS